MSRKTWLTLFLVIPLLACQSQSNNLKAFKLNSGRIIYPKNYGPMITPNMPKEKGFVYSYQTQINIDNVRALREEAEEIWSVIGRDFQKIPGITFAVIQADEPPKGLVLKNSRSYRFVITRKTDGVWEWVSK